MTKEEERERLVKLTQTLRMAADDAARGPCLAVAETKQRCIPPHAPGLRMVPFAQRDPNEMCLPCAAYWHAEMAALTTEEWLRGERFIDKLEAQQGG